MTTFAEDYGMGTFKISYNNSDIAYGHEGRIDEYYTSLIHYPKEKVTIAWCTNGMLYPRDDIMKKVTGIWMNNSITLPDFNTYATIPRSLNNLTGTYTSSSMQISVDCKLRGDKLVVVAQGQEFETEPIDENYFANPQFGYFFEFNPLGKQLIIKETDNNYLLNKVKP